MTTAQLSEVESEIAEIVAKMKPLMARLEELRRIKARMDSERWIAANGVTRQDIDFSEGDGKPYFSVVWKFAEWLKTNSTKRFCEWNQRIYFVSELVSGRMDPDAPATVNELPA